MREEKTNQIPEILKKFLKNTLVKNKKSSYSLTARENGCFGICKIKRGRYHEHTKEARKDQS